MLFLLCLCSVNHVRRIGRPGNQLQPSPNSYPGRCPRRLLHREDALQLKEEGLSRNGPYAMHSDWATLASGPVSRLVYRRGVIHGLGPISFERIPYLTSDKWPVPFLALKKFMFPIWHQVQLSFLIRHSVRFAIREPLTATWKDDFAPVKGPNG